MLFRSVLPGESLLFGIQNYPQYILTDKIFGMVSKVLAKDLPDANGTNKKIILEVTLPGGSFNATISDLESTLFTTPLTSSSGSFWWDATTGTFINDTEGDSASKKFLDFIRLNDANNTAKIIFHNHIAYDSGSGAVPMFTGSSVYGMTGALEYDNLVPNGSFTVWQRPFNNLAGVTIAGLSG